MDELSRAAEEYLAKRRHLSVTEQDPIEKQQLESSNLLETLERGLPPFYPVEELKLPDRFIEWHEEAAEYWKSLKEVKNAKGAAAQEEILKVEQGEDEEPTSIGKAKAKAAEDDATKEEPAEFLDSFIDRLKKLVEEGTEFLKRHKEAKDAKEAAGGDVESGTGRRRFIRCCD